MRWIIDANNVMGAGADGWWNDRAAAAVRTAQAVATWCRSIDGEVTLVFDEPSSTDLAEVAGGNLEIAHATRRGRDAADDRIVELVDAAMSAHPGQPLGVVTSDRGLRSRLPPGVATEGAGTFRRRLGLAVR